MLRHAPDFADPAGLADALLHPQDRSYSVPQLLEFLGRAGLAFGRWVRQAPYLPWCGALASMPHRSRLAALPAEAQYAAIELFRGSMVRHAAIAYRNDRPVQPPIDFDGEAWPDYTPVRLPDTLAVRDRLPPGAAGVLINGNHHFTDLYLPIDAQQDRLLTAIDGLHSIAEICRQTGGDPSLARAFCQLLWRWDQLVFDTSRGDVPSSRRA